MPSRFSTIGFPLLDLSEFSDLATHLAAEAQRIPVSGGTYLLWASPGGEQVWLQGDSDGYLLGLTPHFAGKSQVSVSIGSILRRPGETFLDGTIRGSMNDETRPTGGILDSPIVIDMPNLATHGRLELPMCRRPSRRVRFRGVNLRKRRCLLRISRAWGVRVPFLRCVGNVHARRRSN